MLWLGLVLLVVAAVLFFFAKKSKGKVLFVKATDTSKIGAILQLVEEIAGDMPDGMALGYKDYVEVKGKVVCEEPIQGEISEQVGAIVETEVVRVCEQILREEEEMARWLESNLPMVVNMYLGTESTVGAGAGFTPNTGGKTRF
jgi:hypothetical protein